jgi:hypothetical protein
MCTVFFTVLVPMSPVLKMGLMCGPQAARLCGATDKRHPKANCQQRVEYIHRAHRHSSDEKVEYSFTTTTFGAD